MKSALLAIFLCLAATAFAQSNSGAELRNSGTDYVKVCGPSAQGQPNNLAAACNIWLTGVVDGLQAYNSNLKALPLFDAPNVTVGQVAKLTVKFVADHPDKAQLPAAAVVLGALAENFPRKESSAPPK
jgi:Ssp1 endopeptidase immunity protein Rap1a